MRISEYRGPLGILAAGVIGVSLLCSVSAMAMSDLRNYIPATFVPLNIVDFAVSNLNTAVAFTEQSVTEFVPTATLAPTGTASLTPMPSDTPRTFFTVTPRRTRSPRDPTAAPFLPRRTSTPAPADTDVPPTPVPPTDIPTDLPTVQPTEQPTDIPTDLPTDIPTDPPPTDIPTDPPPTTQPLDVPVPTEGSPPP